MRLVRFLHSKKASYGLLTDEGMVCLPALSKVLRQPLPPHLDGVISLGTEGVRAIEELVHASTEAERAKATLKMDSVVLKAPVASPPKVICLGLNYRDHAEEIEMSVPDEPIFFMKPRTAIVGPDEPVIRPSMVKQLDYEVELAVIMGKKGRNIPVSDAEKHVFGYTVFNDISARDIQFKDKQWTRGKSFDTFAPIGPCVTTANQIEDSSSLSLCTRVNGELRQNSSTRNMVFNVHEVVHHISLVMTLEPGDVIATGTPAGVAVFMKPEPKFLQPGDVVEVEIEKIGTLRNQIVES